MKVYAVVYDETADFLIGYKRNKGHFFWNPKTKGTLNFCGQVLNGADKHALPGGKLNPRETSLAGAKREFLEETGVTIPAGAVETGYAFAWEKLDCCAGYFRIKGGLPSLAKTINENLRQAAEAAAACQQDCGRKPSIKSYDALMTRYPRCPQDNELLDVRIWNVATQWGRVEAFRKDKDLDWYYEVLLHLKEDILKIRK